MSEPPLISVIIPAFNAARVIGETLESVRHQTFENFEVIMVDDSSTDDTSTIAQKFCVSDPRFSLIRQANCGVSAARNRAIHQARGEWIAFLDADDVWMPQKLERQMDLGRQNPRANLLFTNFYIWDGPHDLHIWLEDDHPLPEGDVSRKLVFSISHACDGSMSTAMVRREMFSSSGFFDPDIAICEDWDLLLRMADHGLRVRGTREPLARYRRWPGNVTNQKLKMAEAQVRVLQKNLRTTQRPELRPLYQRSLNLARSRLELVRARQMLDTSPEKTPAAIWRAWRLSPRQIKWLMRYFLVAWPKFLGGRATERIVHRKLMQKF